MARKLRVEFPGAVYHVINRGNYRRWIFDDERTQTAFETCLFETCERSGWHLHAFVIMGNHFHLAVETPAGNLVAGMQWLQSTFANRFNRLRGVNGHLFQGRYKSLVVEPGAALGAVCHYIHLNPVRAGLVAAADLSRYRHGSYWYWSQPNRRPTWLHVGAALMDAGGLCDSQAGRRSYQEYLAWQAAEGPAGRTKAYVNLSRGWALGSGDFKAELVAHHNLQPLARAWETGGAREIREERWNAQLAAALVALQKTNDELAAAPKSAAWKLAIATWLKAQSDADNRWLAAKLNLGAPAAASRNVSLFRKRAHGSEPTWDRLKSISAA